MGAILEAQELHKSFGDTAAVRGVTFSIEEKEIFGLLGPNGAGKTTTIRMLSTVLPPDSGSVSIAGRALSDSTAAVRQLIGVCPQELALYPELSAHHNLVFFGRMTGLSRARAKERAAETLERIGLSDRARDAVRTFSGGMKRRVNIGIALMSRPQLLFLDEPTVGIDPQSRNHIFETVLQLRSEGMSVLYTTHYMEEADRLCDRIAVIDGGSVIALGTASELKGRLGDPATITLEEVFLDLTGHSLRD